MKMYIRIEGDGAMGANFDICCDSFFLKEVIIHLFHNLINFPTITPAITCLKECTEMIDKKLQEEKDESN